MAINRIAQLRLELTNRLSESEVRTLCFDLGIDFENLPGDTKADKVRELLSALDRSRRISELLLIGPLVRSDIDWGWFLNTPSERVEPEQSEPGNPNAAYSAEKQDNSQGKETTESLSLLLRQSKKYKDLRWLLQTQSPEFSYFGFTEARSHNDMLGYNEIVALVKADMMTVESIEKARQIFDEAVQTAVKERERFNFDMAKSPLAPSLYYIFEHEYSSSIIKLIQNQNASPAASGARYGSLYGLKTIGRIVLPGFIMRKYVGPTILFTQYYSYDVQNQRLYLYNKSQDINLSNYLLL